LRFSGEILKDEEGNPVLDSSGKQIKKYSPLIIDKMVYAASKIADYDLRIPEASTRLLKTNIPVQDIVNDELSNDTSVSLAKALYNIDQQKSERIDTDLVKQQLKDVVELSRRRQQFVNEYNDLKENPQNYSYTGEKEEFTPEGKKTRTAAPKTDNSQYFSKSRNKFKSDKRTYSDIVNQYGEGEKSKYEVLQKITESPYATVLEKQLAAAFLNFTTRDSKIILGDRTLSTPGRSTRGTDANSALSRINYEDTADDYENGNIYTQSLDLLMDDTFIMKRTRIMPYIVDDLEYLYFSKFQIDQQVGIGTVGGNAWDIDPLMALSWSDDQGNTWSNYHYKSMGKVGDYLKRVLWFRPIA